jgi:hypothetical protein
VKLLVAHADGLVTEDTAEAPNMDPIPSGVDLLVNLATFYGYPLILTFDGSHPTYMEAWLRGVNIKPMRLVASGDLSASVRMERTLSIVGDLQSTVGLFLGASTFDCKFMSSHGYPAIQFHQPQADRVGWGLKPGATWDSLQQQLQTQP